MRAYQGEIDYERLGAYLRTLSVPTRILLLQKLQHPQAPSEIELPPFRKHRDWQEDRTLSRQAVEGHLKKLEEVGLVRSREGDREGQPVREYLLDSARLFVMVDELRRLSLLRPAPSVAGGWAGATGDMQTVDRDGGSSAVELPEGPALVLVSGPLEGTVFPFEGEGPWVVGRSTAAAASISHDPYVSGQNAEVWRGDEGTEEGGDGWFIRDLPSSSNGTALNWRLLEKGEAAQLKPGDTVGVGRSLLVFRPG